MRIELKVEWIPFAIAAMVMFFVLEGVYMLEQGNRVVDIALQEANDTSLRIIRAIVAQHTLMTVVVVLINIILNLIAIGLISIYILKEMREE